MKIAVVGAGPAGLVAVKYSLEKGHKCDCFEQTGSIGGTWVYTDQVEIDNDGVLVHSSMYKDLITNFPKECMAYVDFPYPKDKTVSYITQNEVLDYLHAYADKFNVKKHIQLYKRVVSIVPDNNKKWYVTIKDTKTQSEQVVHYDAVLICNGRYYQPIIPEIKGQHLFKGPQTHSRSFRTEGPFKNKTVLIVGGAYSGQELCLRIAEVAKHVYFSYRPTKIYINFPKNSTPKPEVSEFLENGAKFLDGTTAYFECILYCTGFQYVCNFVNKESGLTIQDNWISPLYKHIINVRHPTMCFIGIPYISLGIPMFDMQVRFALAALEKKFKLPSEEEMVKELDEYMKNRRDNHIPDFQAHKLGGPEPQEAYLQELSNISGIPQLPSVIYKIYTHVKNCFKANYSFKILDDDNYAATYLH